MADRLKDKVALITGGASGIGRAGCDLPWRARAQRSSSPISTLRRAEAVAREIEAAGGEALVVVGRCAGLSASVQAMVAAAVERFGRIDMLFHNAVSVPLVNKHDRRITELPEETWHAIVGLVLTGTFLTAKYVAQKMLEQRSGSIILTATVDALIGQAGLDAYTAAKGGVVSMTRSMAAGLSPEGVRVNAICPGFVATPHQSVFLDDREGPRSDRVAAPDGHHGPRGSRRLRGLPGVRRGTLDDRRHPRGRQRLHGVQEPISTSACVFQALTGDPPCRGTPATISCSSRSPSARRP